jgi:hypothetical protein
MTKESQSRQKKRYFCLFHIVQTGSGTHLVLSQSYKEIFRGQATDAWNYIHIHLMPRLEMCKAIRHVFTAWCLIKQTQRHFTF